MQVKHFGLSGFFITEMWMKYDLLHLNSVSRWQLELELAFIVLLDIAAEQREWIIYFKSVFSAEIHTKLHYCNDILRHGHSVWKYALVQGTNED